MSAESNKPSDEPTRAADSEPGELEPLEPELQRELERARSDRDAYLAQWQRAQADYQNLKKRSAAEADAAVRRTLTPLFEQVMLAIDNLDLALANERGDSQSPLAAGVRLIHDQLVRGLEQAGVQRIARGERFDPALQDAIATEVRDDVEPDTVLDVLREGYTFQGQVLRPAQVRVSTRSRAARGAESL